METIRHLVQQQKANLKKIRRELHRIPETAFKEEKTSAYIIDYLDREGFELQTGIAKTGVVAHLKTGRPGPTLMIRADMDALPLSEQTGLAFASTHNEVMHACGHDAHMAMLLVTASILKALQDQFRGHIKFVFQPAEEALGGAKPMIEEGVLEHPNVDYAIGCHLWPESPEGTIGVAGGPIMAAMDHFELTIVGRGGHGAMPHQCVDPIDVGSQVVNAIQRIVSRQLDPLKPAVISFGSFHAGSAPNIIPGEARLSGTTRTFDDRIWQSWQERIETVIKGVCGSMGADFRLIYTRACPATVNDAQMAAIVKKCAQAVVGKKHVVVPDPTMGSEDMAFYLQRCKGCYYFVGTGRRGCASVHNPTFDFNEDVMCLGVETHCRLAAALLGLSSSNPA